MPSYKKPWVETRRFRSVKASLGLWGITIVLGGSLTCLGILGLLWYVWKAGDLTVIWRWIVLNSWLTEVVTILSAILQIVVLAQSVLATSLIAGLLIEKHGVPLTRVAEVSILRNANYGPSTLLWMFFSSTSFLRTAKMPIILALNLVSGFVAAPFLSAVLFTDLDIRNVAGQEHVLDMGSEIDLASQQLEQQPLLSFSPSFTPFGTAMGASDTSISEKGVSDTGVVQRVFIPMDDKDRTSLRDYQGKAYVHSSRFVCVRPTVKGGVEFVDGRQGVVPQFSGTIDVAATWSDAALPMPQNCSALSCLLDAANFECALPVQSTSIPGSRTVSLCYPRRTAFFIDPARELGNEPVSRFSEVILVLTSNFTSEAMDNLRQQGGTSIPMEIRSEEFTVWEFEDVALSMSLCLKQQTFDFADVRLTAESDMATPTPSWDDKSKGWDMQGVMRLYAAAPGRTSRGTYEVESVTGLIKNPITTFLVGSPLIIPRDIPSQGDNQSLVVHFSPSETPDAAVAPVNALMAGLFTAMLAATARPAVALQSLLTAMASTSLAALQPQLTVTHSARMLHSSPTLAPASTKGLAAVSAIVLSHVLCVLGTTALYLRYTRHSAAVGMGSWRAASQLLSDETAWVLDEATEFDDNAIADMMGGDGRREVRVARTFGEGARVQVVPVPGQGGTSLTVGNEGVTARRSVVWDATSQPGVPGGGAL
jgi:hypothetical protein